MSTRGRSMPIGSMTEWLPRSPTRQREFYPEISFHKMTSLCNRMAKERRLCRGRQALSQQVRSFGGFGGRPRPRPTRNTELRNDFNSTISSRLCGYMWKKRTTIKPQHSSWVDCRVRTGIGGNQTQTQNTTIPYNTYTSITNEPFLSSDGWLALTIIRRVCS